jgi:hypothetical protein
MGSAECGLGPWSIIVVHPKLHFIGTHASWASFHLLEILRVGPRFSHLNFFFFFPSGDSPDMFFFGRKGISNLRASTFKNIYICPQ